MKGKKLIAFADRKKIKGENKIWLLKNYKS